MPRLVNFSVLNFLLQECAVAALANMAVNYKCCILAIELGGLNALVSIVQRCKYERALEQV